MHISNVEAKLMEQDLMTIINDFVKVDNLFINEITLNDYVDIRGTFKTFFNLNFQIRAELIEAKGKLIKLSIKNIKVNKIGIFSFIRNKALKIALKKLALEGIDYTGKEIVLELDKLLKKVPYVAFDVTRVEILTGYLVAAVEDINISVSELLKGNEKNTSEKIDTEAEESDGMKDLNDNSKKDNKAIYVEEKLDDTVIVAFADHYLYTVEDKTILDRHKSETKNNLINHTPMFIYSKGLTKKNIKEVTSQLDILPTVLNLFGMDYNPTYYLGKDALNPNYKGIVFFSDYSWYDGKVYVENGKVVNNKKIKASSLEEKNSYVAYITEKNDKILKYDYFKNRNYLWKQSNPIIGY